MGSLVLVVIFGSSFVWLFCYCVLRFWFFVVLLWGDCLIVLAYNVLMADMVLWEKRGRIMGIIGTLNVMATVPASALAGLLYSLDPAFPFVFSIVLGIVVALIILLAVKEPKIREI